MMDRKEIMAKVNEIARDVFDNNAVTLTDATTATDVEEWDSLTHLLFTNEIEDEFGITFTLSEVTKSKNVGELVDAISRHLGGN